MKARLIQVDAFTSRPFAGNPAAVCLPAEEADARWMQDVAAEMNLAETAFLSREGEGYRLRWFTPTQEVDLCGHATLASAHALWEEGFLQRSEDARFDTRSGRLTARWTAEGIELNLPADPPTPAPAPPALLKAVGGRATYCGATRLGYLLEVESERELRGLSPDFTAMKGEGGRPVIVTARSARPEFDFVSRFFAPTLGVDEDPVTGAAHCCLAPYWEARLGHRELRAFQASRRGGELRVRTQGDRVLLTGTAVTVLRGELV